MIRIENTDVYGWAAAVRGMRNPLNSWAKSDSTFRYFHGKDGVPEYCTSIGEADLNLMKKLVKSGTEHAKFMRFLTVTADVTSSLYWWKEFDTYKVGTVANSCSTMHTLHKKELELDDFSIEKYDLPEIELYEMAVVVSKYLNLVEGLRRRYVESGNKEYWRALIQLLPTSYNQRRTIQVNYAVLRQMYKQRRNHKLTEWQEFCEWIETLPYSELITD